MAKQRLRVIPLGGLGEIGKNMLLLEFGDDIIAIDAGLMFPEEEVLGVDLVIPDISYLEERRHRLRALIITHGHEDHTGALPYLLPRLDAPVYCTRLTEGLISVKLKGHKLLSRARLKVVRPGDEVPLGKLRVEFFRVGHSIPDAVGLIIRTPMGTIVHSGDFKLDHTPVDGKPLDISRLAQVGGEGVMLLLSDSTYVEEAGYTPSEKMVGETLDHIIGEATGRVIIATFASLIARIQQVMDAAARHGRQVFILGRSMVDNVRMALALGYLHPPPDTLATLDRLHKLPPNRIVIVTTGTQGEPTSALVRMAHRDHRQVRIQPGDTVVLSATPIPGNESLINRTVDNLFRQGADVLYHKLAPVHVHGHGSQEELKLILNLVKPRFFVPIHGEYRHLRLHARLAQSLGLAKERIFVLEDGDILELTPERGRVVGKLDSGHVYVDGLGVAAGDSIVLRDRRVLAQDGIVVVVITIDKQTGKLVRHPEVVSRGFAAAEELLEESRELVARTLDRTGERPAERGFINTKVKDALGRFLYKQTKRRPLILSAMVEV
ncbi:MAG TPA: ribonuclease J [Dehalococcoidia bacterium]|nr:ribonuclease J [Dehalococcoidia bacterium]